MCLLWVLPVASRGIGYGVETYRIDGNDVLAVHKVTSHARHICVEEGRPVLIEAMTYRVGHHSTSDDSSKYRPVDEVATWNATNCPIKRLQGLLHIRGIWSEESNKQLIKQVQDLIIHRFYLYQCCEHLRPAGSVFHHYLCSLLYGAISIVSSRLHLLLIGAS